MRRAWVTLFVLGGCSSPQAPSGGPAAPSPAPPPAFTVPAEEGPPSGWRDSQRVEIEEVVHRRSFVDTRLHLAIAAFCLARTRPAGYIPWEDPPPALIARFRRNNPAVKPLSACRMEPDGVRSVFDLETGGRAVIFRAGPPEWESDTEAVVIAGHHLTGLGGAEFSYRMRYVDGAWTVVSSRQLWIS